MSLFSFDGLGAKDELHAVAVGAGEAAIAAGYVDGGLQSVAQFAQITVESVHQLLNAFFVQLLQTVGQLSCAVIQLLYTVDQGGHTAVELGGASLGLCHTGGVSLQSRVEGVVAVQLLLQRQKLLGACTGLPRRR